MSRIDISFSNYRIWQMDCADCSTNLVSSLIFNAHIVGPFLFVGGDCQYVLLRVTTPPQVLIVSVISKSLKFVSTDCYRIFILLMQQTFPKIHDPLGRPPNNEHTEPDAQIPELSFGVVQSSNGPIKLGLSEIGIRLARFAKGLNMFAGLNRLLKIVVFRKPPRMKRFSAWFWYSLSLKQRTSSEKICKRKRT